MNDETLQARVEQLEGELMYWRELVMALVAQIRPPPLIHFADEVSDRLQRTRAMLEKSAGTDARLDGFQRAWHYQQNPEPDGDPEDR